MNADPILIELRRGAERELASLRLRARRLADAIRKCEQHIAALDAKIGPGALGGGTGAEMNATDASDKGNLARGINKDAQGFSGSLPEHISNGPKSPGADKEASA